VSELADQPTSDFPTTGSEIAFRSARVIDVRTDQVRMPDGAQATRDVVVHPGAVGVIAMDEQSRILLLQQYRHAVGRLLWEPPAGLLDGVGEDPLDAAKRELYEEAHLEAGRWDVLVDAFTSPGMTDEAVRIYLARDVRESAKPKYEAEHEEVDMPTRWVPLPEAVEAVFGGRIHNPLAVMGILAAAAAGPAYDTLREAGASWPEMSDYPGSANVTAAESG
jgi:ADP-ribose pyrophosphatase